jgi:hypothetical protein
MLAASRCLSIGPPRFLRCRCGGWGTEDEISPVLVRLQNGIRNDVGEAVALCSAMLLLGLLRHGSLLGAPADDDEESDGDDEQDGAATDNTADDGRRIRA